MELNQINDGKMKIRLYHITSPDMAMQIMDSGKYHPVSIALLNNDNGLNCFAFKRGYWQGQCIENTGAKIIFEWSGLVSITHPDTAPPLDIDILHDQIPWRCFVRAGTSSDHLRLLAIRFDKGVIDDMTNLNFWQQFLPDTIQKSLRRRLKLQLLKSIRSNYRNQNKLLKVVA